MFRYENKGFTIEVMLPKSGYSVECQYMQMKDSDKFAVTMWLKRRDIDEKFKIEEQKIDTQLITSSRATIRNDISRIVEQAYTTGFFNKYINEFEYTSTCFDIGNELHENGSLQWTPVV